MCILDGGLGDGLRGCCGWLHARPYGPRRHGLLRRLLDGLRGALLLRHVDLVRRLLRVRLRVLLGWRRRRRDVAVAEIAVVLVVLGDPG